MTARECAIQGAAMAEQNAQEFCKKLAELTKDGPLHRLYNELTTMEDGRVAYLENMLATSPIRDDVGVN
jgi:rubrerythrin